MGPNIGSIVGGQGGTSEVILLSCQTMNVETGNRLSAKQYQKQKGFRKIYI